MEREGEKVDFSYKKYSIIHFSVTFQCLSQSMGELESGRYFILCLKPNQEETIFIVCTLVDIVVVDE